MDTGQKCFRAEGGNKKKCNLPRAESGRNDCQSTSSRFGELQRLRCLPESCPSHKQQDPLYSFLLNMVFGMGGRSGGGAVAPNPHLEMATAEVRLVLPEASVSIRPSL